MIRAGIGAECQDPDTSMLPSARCLVEQIQIASDIGDAEASLAYAVTTEKRAEDDSVTISELSCTQCNVGVLAIHESWRLKRLAELPGKLAVTECCAFPGNHSD